MDNTELAVAHVEDRQNKLVLAHLQERTVIHRTPEKDRRHREDRQLLGIQERQAQLLAILHETSGLNLHGRGLHVSLQDEILNLALLPLETVHADHTLVAARDNVIDAPNSWSVLAAHRRPEDPHPRLT